MKEERKVAEESGNYRPGRPFLQPLAVALVCLLLVTLLLIMGFMNLKALERTLNGYMENRGLTILKDVHQVAEHNFQLLTQKNQAFYRFWTRKEAFVKATGHGIALGLNQCVINPENPTEFLSVPDNCGQASEWRVQDIVLGEGICGAVVTDKKFSVIGLMDFAAISPFMK